MPQSRTMPRSTRGSFSVSRRSSGSESGVHPAISGIWRVTWSIISLRAASAAARMFASCALAGERRIHEVRVAAARARAELLEELAMRRHARHGAGDARLQRVERLAQTLGPEHASHLVIAARNEA